MKKYKKGNMLNKPVKELMKMLCRRCYLKECDGCLECFRDKLPSKRQSSKRRKAFLAIQKKKREKIGRRMVGK